MLSTSRGANQRVVGVMDETQERIEELEQTVGKLGRSDRANRRCLLYALGMIVLVFLFAAYMSRRTAPVLRAEQFQVVGENGEVLCLLTQGEHGEGLINLLDAHDHTVLSLGSNESGGVLTLLNRGEQAVAQMESINSAGVFQLRDRNDQVVVSLETGEAGA